ncbi:MAG: NAD(P)-dependent oxidoreductase [Deltaproteobacteria bacterium]|nr:NAD(P)-dependent oxidoreductase [Deltaproteobacteria bacterium]MBW2053121.1 NAD(P)-dependent oxidoreductase [Deltaproteobacteria bacterium]MBW2141454.1 NAD(P)-dependent oxidoreductase [Deltaproteobacteria bacterium]MBW2322575.1 NAD(P)-dependent oxidoreductase [Deltaproteobacteria bacterium]
MRILLTGASGFIGRNLARHMAMNSNYEVICLARRLLHVEESHPDLQYIQADLSRSGWTQRLPSRIDVVCHLAQSSQYRDFPGGARDMMAVNIEGTFELLEWARGASVKKFIFTSTGNVYAPSENPLKEDDPLGPSSMYGASKAAAEMIITPYGDLYNCSILRLFGVYGPGQTGMLIPTMIKKIRDGGRITLDGGVGLRFTPLFIEECLKMLDWVVNDGTTSKGVDVYNLCGAEVITLRQAVDHLGELMGIQPNTETTCGEITSLIGDNRKLAEAMQYSPRIGYLEGLKKTVGA